jgi:hypothetical protein
VILYMEKLYEQYNVDNINDLLYHVYEAKDIKSLGYLVGIHEHFTLIIENLSKCMYEDIIASKKTFILDDHLYTISHGDDNV